VKPKDDSLDTLLELDGESFVLEGLFWVKFEVKKVPVSSEKPHGLDYSLTLHDDRGARLLGYDNAHGIQEGRGREREPVLSTTISIRVTVCVSMTTQTRSPCSRIFGRM
jgi:hypothetical protein